MLWVAGVKGPGLKGGGTDHIQPRSWLSKGRLCGPGPAAEAAEGRGGRPGPDVTWLIPLPMAVPRSPLRARGRSRRVHGRAGGAAGGGARAALAARSAGDTAWPARARRASGTAALAPAAGRPARTRT